MKNLLLQRLFVFICLSLSMSVWAETVYWIDVRTAEEYSEQHVEQAVNIPYDQIAEKIATVTKDKSAEIYLYCRSGNRAGKAKVVLETMGYTGVINLGGLSDGLQMEAADTVVDTAIKTAT